MTDRPSLARVPPPDVPAPPGWVDRRTHMRRAADRIEHGEKALLARGLDILAADVDAEVRLARVLRLLARSAGARWAGVVSDRTERRVAVGVAAHDDPTAAAAFGAWLDNAARRSRAMRAAAGPAPILVVVDSDEAPARPGDRSGDESAEHRSLVPIAGVPGVVLGFEFATARSMARLDERLPPPMARHAAVILALAADRLAMEREAADMRRVSDERNRFVSTVAHELRTPLTGLSGYLDLILDGKVEDDAVEREFLERGRGIVTAMAELVGDLLELSRLEAGSIRLEIDTFSVAEAVRTVGSRLHPIALDHGVDLAVTVPPVLQAATGDRRRVEQIVTNMTANALKFTPSGRRVELVGWFVGYVAVIAVRDEGAGIATDDRARIFERFYRMAAHERVTGTGLGLPIARELARAMGGDLDVASVVGSGSSFVLALPGPAPTDAAAVGDTLQDVLVAEEIALEERVVLRALQAGGRPATRPA